MCILFMVNMLPTVVFSYPIYPLDAIIVQLVNLVGQICNFNSA